MMELFLVYLWLKLDTLGITLWIAIAILGVILAVFFIGYNDDDVDSVWIKTDTGKKGRYGEPIIHKERKKFFNWFPKWPVVLFFALLTFNISLPSSKDAAILFGTHYAMKALESPEGHKVVSIMRKRVNDYLDAEINKK